MNESFPAALTAAWARMQDSLLLVVPRLLSLIALLVVGWIVALGLRAATAALLKAIRVRSLMERAGMSGAMEKVGLGAPEHLVGSVVFWAIWASFLISGLYALGIEPLEQLATDLLRLLVRLLGAAAVLMVGLGVANFMWRVVLLAAVNARVREARLLGGAVRWLIVLGAVAMGLEQIDLGGRVMHTAFAIVFGAVALAAAIALGLGGRHAARRYIERRLLSQEAPPEEGAPRPGGGGAHL